MSGFIRVQMKKNGEIVDTVHPARPAFWSISLSLAEQCQNIKTVNDPYCSILYSLGRFLGRVE
jgi:hypothetical protein